MTGEREAIMNSTTETTIDPRLLVGLTVRVEDIASVATDHYSTPEVPCRRCGVYLCPSWRVAAPLLRHRHAEVPGAAAAWLVKVVSQPVPRVSTSTTPVEDAPLFDPEPYRVAKPRRSRR
jgi:hypothetical protein